MANNKKTKKKGYAKTLTVLCTAAVLVAVTAAAVHKNSDAFFAAGEFIGVNCQKNALEKRPLSHMTAVGLDELRARDNTEFNQSMMLINNRYMLPEDFSAQISEYKETGVFMNGCMKESYSRLSAAVKEQAEDNLYVSSDYRTLEEQKELFEQSPDTAIQPNASEHQSGLALDVYVKNFAGEGFIKSEAGRFVNSKCWEYGFIIRYPSFGEEITEIPFEPWHIRYVGEPHAKLIYNNHLTLEEYVSSLEKGAWYEAEGWLISRQEPSADTLQLSQDYDRAVISPDNTGCYIITIKQ